MAAHVPEAASQRPPPTSGRRATEHALKLRRAGLSTQIEVHDRQQLEIRFSYALGRTNGAQLYTVDTYFFLPRNVGVNRANYAREQFYGDVTALMRLEAAPLDLDRLADVGSPESPLYRFERALDEFRTSARPPRSKPAMIHVKLYAYLYALGVKAELAQLTKTLRSLEHAGRGRAAGVEAALDSSLQKVSAALWSYRKVRAAFWPFEKIAHQSFPEVMRAADEYMSLFLEERLAMLVAQLEKEERRFDGSGLVARCRLRIAAVAKREAEYRTKYGYLTLTESGLSEGEYFTYRASHLKKTVQQALYLAPREVEADMFVRNAVGAVGAALAAIWALALATQLPATFVGLSAGTQLMFFAAGVGAYVLKDRIKAFTNDILIKRLKKFDHTSWLTSESLDTIGLGMLRARMREAMRFLHSAEVPPEIRAVRLAKRTVRNAEVVTEEVIHYRKVLEVRSRDDSEPLPDGYNVRDILRFNVRHFLVRLDEPLDGVAYFDPQVGAFAAADLPKVYHVNVVAKITREDEGGGGQERLERLRVVLNKEGIVRVDEVEAGDPRPLGVH
jgi:hypothetical protein